MLGPHLLDFSNEQENWIFSVLWGKPYVCVRACVCVLVFGDLRATVYVQEIIYS